MMRSAGKYLTIKTDGVSRGNPGPAAIGIVVFDESGSVVREIAQSIGTTTNNQAEYRALIAGLEAAAGLGAERIEIRLDSRLVVNQVRGTYKAKSAKLRPLLRQARQLLSGFSSFGIEHIPRCQNKEADALANQALDRRVR